MGFPELGLSFPKDRVRWGSALVLTTAAWQDEESAIVMLKRHLRQQRTVEEYGRNIKHLAGRAQNLLSAGHPEGYVCLLDWYGRVWESNQGPFRSQGGEMGPVSTELEVSELLVVSISFYSLGCAQKSYKVGPRDCIYGKVRVRVPLVNWEHHSFEELACPKRPAGPAVLQQILR